ncbi:TetR/AcrR family transcriptional regulator [Brachybacterium sillae]|uniref:TetR/AcrR family transcriptional regulator n=1 Tax=Brachybacterium sillae TaxID=2810536 RepID=UPI00217F0415|nr:TetR/AcrR family transcriptional regulator [Brachybacterium sillae]
MTDIFEAAGQESPRGRAATRMRLVRASLPVFVEKGLDAATIDDLVSAAGFTRGAFYSNFSSKEELFDALFETVTDEVCALVRDSVPQEPRGLSDQPSGLRADQPMVDVFAAIRPFGRQWYLLYSEAVSHALRSDSARERLAAQRGRLQAEIAHTLERGMAATGDRPLIPLPSLAELVIGIYVDLMVREHLQGEDVTDIAPELILGSLRAFVDGPGPCTRHAEGTAAPAGE